MDELSALQYQLIICSSIPTYGAPSEAGNETGYVVGRSMCYPSPGSVKISTGESLVLESSYGRGHQRFTGVMGSFYVLDADE
ncbi:hypothetical protein Vadar_006745 [Vaccinium darrowii]|uniref:Uncharacterized protein n=1 Tax=Vaccinium darrowii TaxID=229202 RepID=A0ACB7ZHK0_9ERIC|nr:hypothetical protein Vadar_006745 [Vaccinium darrowii]